jgi:hypothetical protein
MYCPSVSSVLVIGIASSSHQSNDSIIQKRYKNIRYGIQCETTTSYLLIFSRFQFPFPTPELPLILNQTTCHFESHLSSSTEYLSRTNSSVKWKYRCIGPSKPKPDSRSSLHLQCLRDDPPLNHLTCILDGRCGKQRCR